MVERIMEFQNMPIWHSISFEESLKETGSDGEKGLSEKEALSRKEKFGPNIIKKKKQHNPLLIFLSQLNQPLIYVMLFAAFVTLFLHEYIDSSVIFGVILINAVVGYIQEAKAVNALAALAKSMVSQTTVIRDGHQLKVCSEELVVGDIVLLSAGDKVTADMRLVFSKNLRINESVLTGESLPAEKVAKPVHKDSVLADRSNIAYASTLVTNGFGRAVVISIGNDTEVGKISDLIESSETLETPLTKKISYFSKILLYVIVAFSAVTFFVGSFVYSNPILESFMAVVALAVGAIPEGLPAAVTIILAIGVSRMAGRKAIIRRLPAVETLGSTTVICSDKTGTLTENKMTVQGIFAGGKTYSVSGHGYLPVGKIFDGEMEIDRKENPALEACLVCGVLCNDSKLAENESGYYVQGDPTEGALLVAAEKSGMVNREKLDETTERIDVIPFESENQYMATLNKVDWSSDSIAYIKGSIEAVLPRCSSVFGGGEFERQSILAAAEKFASGGLRVIALAQKTFPAEKVSVDHEDINSGLVFLGFQAMMDPPREEAIAAIRSCHSAGIIVKMITGDHVETARAIAKKIGLRSTAEGDPQNIIAVTGSEIAKWTEEEFPKKAIETSVFARVAPEQKLHIVKALQSLGHVVAMTGDGVNDAPALKQADIGISMGKEGTEVAKEAAEMVLTDDNFASIEAAVEEGRGVFDNLRKFIAWSIPTNGSEGLVLMVAIIFNLTLPISPLQILWINMMTVIFLGTTLAFEPKEDDLMSRPPNDPKMPIFTKDLSYRAITVTVLLVFMVFILYALEAGRGFDAATIQTIASNVLVMGGIFYLFNCRSFEKSVFQIGLFSNPIAIAGVFLMVAAQLLFTYAPFMNELFGTKPIGIEYWLEILFFGAVLYFIVEAEKKVRNIFRRDV